MTIRFVQFPHPGSEHKPETKNGNKFWSPTTRQHARKFMNLTGTLLVDEKSQSGQIWAWGEWEAESSLLNTLTQPDLDYPKYIWSPYYTNRNDFNGLHNTDPFIFDGFYYTDCKQDSSPQLKYLSPGSIIIFGSSKVRIRRGPRLSGHFLNVCGFPVPG